MDQVTERAFNFLREVKSVTFATVNNGKPDVRIADIMLAEEDGLYFLTARGKPFFRQLMKDRYVAICGMDKNYVTVRVMGDIKVCDGRSIVDKIFDRNPMINDLYSGEKRNILEAFHLYRGKGEIFDLSSEPPERKRFSFGGETVNPSGYRITESCTACSLCFEGCPVGAISEGDIYKIDESRCLECGRCREVCPEDAIQESSGL